MANPREMTTTTTTTATEEPGAFMGAVNSVSGWFRKTYVDATIAVEDFAAEHPDIVDNIKAGLLLNPITGPAIMSASLAIADNTATAEEVTVTDPATVETTAPATPPPAAEAEPASAATTQEVTEETTPAATTPAPAADANQSVPTTAVSQTVFVPAAGYEAPSADGQQDIANIEAALPHMIALAQNAGMELPARTIEAADGYLDQNEIDIINKVSDYLRSEAQKTPEGAELLADYGDSGSGFTEALGKAMRMGLGNKLNEFMANEQMSDVHGSIGFLREDNRYKDLMRSLTDNLENGVLVATAGEHKVETVQVPVGPDGQPVTPPPATTTPPAATDSTPSVDTSTLDLTTSIYDNGERGTNDRDEAIEAIELVQTQAYDAINEMSPFFADLMDKPTADGNFDAGEQRNLSAMVMLMKKINGETNPNGTFDEAKLVELREALLTEDSFELLRQKLAPLGVQKINAGDSAEVQAQKRRDADEALFRHLLVLQEMGETDPNAQNVTAANLAFDKIREFLPDWVKDMLQKYLGETGIGKMITGVAAAKGMNLERLWKAPEEDPEYNETQVLTESKSVVLAREFEKYVEAAEAELKEEGAENPDFATVLARAQENLVNDIDNNKFNRIGKLVLGQEYDTLRDDLKTAIAATTGAANIADAKAALVTSVSGIEGVDLEALVENTEALRQEAQRPNSFEEYRDSFGEQPAPATPPPAAEADPASAATTQEVTEETNPAASAPAATTPAPAADANQSVPTTAVSQTVFVPAAGYEAPSADGQQDIANIEAALPHMIALAQNAGMELPARTIEAADGYLDQNEIEIINKVSDYLRSEVQKNPEGAELLADYGDSGSGFTEALGKTLRMGLGPKLDEFLANEQMSDVHGSIGFLREDNRYKDLMRSLNDNLEGGVLVATAGELKEETVPVAAPEEVTAVAPVLLASTMPVALTTGSPTSTVSTLPVVDEESVDPEKVATLGDDENAREIVTEYERDPNTYVVLDVASNGRVKTILEALTSMDADKRPYDPEDLIKRTNSGEIIDLAYKEHNGAFEKLAIISQLDTLIASGETEIHMDQIERQITTENLPMIEDFLRKNGVPEGQVEEAVTAAQSLIDQQVNGKSVMATQFGNWDQIRISEIRGIVEEINPEVVVVTAEPEPAPVIVEPEPEPAPVIVEREPFNPDSMSLPNRRGAYDLNAGPLAQVPDQRPVLQPTFAFETGPISAPIPCIVGSAIMPAGGTQFKTGESCYATSDMPGFTGREGANKPWSNTRVEQDPNDPYGRGRTQPMYTPLGISLGASGYDFRVDTRKDGLAQEKDEDRADAMYGRTGAGSVGLHDIFTWRGVKATAPQQDFGARTLAQEVIDTYYEYREKFDDAGMLSKSTPEAYEQSVRYTDALDRAATMQLAVLRNPRMGRDEQVAKIHEIQGQIEEYYQRVTNPAPGPVEINVEELFSGVTGENAIEGYEDGIKGYFGRRGPLTDMAMEVLEGYKEKVEAINNNEAISPQEARQLIAQELTNLDNNLDIVASLKEMTSPEAVAAYMAKIDENIGTGNLYTTRAYAEIDSFVDRSMNQILSDDDKPIQDKVNEVLQAFEQTTQGVDAIFLEKQQAEYALAQNGADAGVIDNGANVDALVADNAMDQPAVQTNIGGR